MTDLDRVLAERAAAIPVPTGDVDAVVRRGRARRRDRRLRALTGLAAVVVLVVVLGGVVVARDDRPAPTSLGAGPGIVRGAPSFAWERGQSGPVLSDAGFGDVASFGGRVVGATVVPMVPSFPAPGPPPGWTPPHTVSVGVSDDGGASFAHSTLPIHAPSQGAVQVQVTTGPTGSVVVVLHDDEPVGFFAAPGSSAFERVRLPQGLAAQDLLLEAVGTGYTAVLGSETGGVPSTTVLTSADGVSWEAAPGPPLAVGVPGTALGRVGGTDVVIGTVSRGAYARDGRPVVARRTDGGWQVSPLSGAFGPEVADAADHTHLEAGAIGPLGIVLVVGVGEGPTVGEPASGQLTATVLHVLSSPDGVTWADERLRGLAGGHEPTPEERLAGLSRSPEHDPVGPVVVLDDHVVVMGGAGEALIGRRR